MTGPDPRRREELLELAEQLAKRLRSIEVPYLGDPSAVSRGVPASVVSNVTSYLARVRDSDRFREFLARIEQLDPITAQNPDNPKADHRVLREELEAFLADRPDLPADELLYVLAWVRRLLPKTAGQNGGRGGRGGRNAGPAHEPRPDRGSKPIKGGQLAAAFERARGDRKRDGAAGNGPRGR